LKAKMSDSGQYFVFGDIKPYNFELLPKKGHTHSINYEELAAASADVGPEQPPVTPTSGPGSKQELD